VDNTVLPLEERVARLEGAFGVGAPLVFLTTPVFLWAFGLSVAALVLAVMGLGPPNHYYQAVLGTLTIVLGYHRRWFAWPAKWFHWSLAILNAGLLSIVIKLVIGGGERFPLFWLKYPLIEAEKKEGSLLNVFPSWHLSWEPTALAQWNVDLTIIQTFLVLITILGALFGFQLFVSLVAFLLVIVSLPALVAFDWQWVFPALIFFWVAIYLQSSRARL